MSNIFLVLLGLFAIFLFLQIMKGAPFVPSKKAAVEAMVKLAAPRPGEKMVDLGSGNGKILIAFAQAGAIARGFEINPLLVLWANRKIKKLGLQANARAYWKSFWQADLKDYTIVTVFGIDNIMKDLGDKITAESPPGAKVLSNLFEFPGWKQEQKLDSIRLYVKKQQI